MKNRVLLAVTLGIALGASLYIRSFPIYFPQLKAHAQKVVDKSIEQSAIQEIRQKFPQFYPLAQDKIVRSKIAEVKRQSRNDIKKQINDIYVKLKERYQDENGQTYMMELDCWHWSRYVENVVMTGHPGDERIYGNEWDMYMLAPLGWCINWDNFLYYLSAFLYKAFSLIHKVPLFTFLFYLPLVFTASLVLSLYFISFRYGKHVGAMIACLYVGCAQIFIPRSCAGWFDKDILCLIFPLAVVWAYLRAFEAPLLKKRILWLSIASFLTGLFSFAWTHWWFVFYIVILYEFLSIALLAFDRFYRKKKNAKLMRQHAISVVIYIFLSLAIAFFMSGTEMLIELYKQSVLAIRLNRPLVSSIWPNVFSTVGETRKVPILDLARSIGGVNIVGIALLCLVVQLIRTLANKRLAGFKRESALIFTVWFASMLFASTRGVRFIMFVVMPLGIALGWAVNDMLEYFIKRKNRWAFSLVAITSIVICVSLIRIADKTASSGTFPLINDTWYKVLNVIREKTPRETILNSWWDYGDWFKVIGRRRVIFDGQSQGYPQAYWMAKSILSNDENKAVGMLRMMNNGGNKAFEIINEYITNPLQAVLLLESIIGSSYETAKATLLKYLPPAEAESVLKILYYTPPSAVFIVEDSMIGKMAAISYLGDWDFSKVYIAQNFDKEEKAQVLDYLKNLGRNSGDIERFYQEVFLISTKNLDDWLSHRVIFYSEVMTGQEKDGLVFFNTGFVYDPKEHVMQANTGQTARSVFTLSGDEVVEDICPRGNVGFSAIIYKIGDGWKAILCDRELGKSIFARLYFFKGKGLKHFTSFIDVEEGDNYIRCYNIAW